MAEIVLVHGIGQEQRAADTLESLWLPNLAGGVRAAGHPGLADALWRDARPGTPNARMAFYADLFAKPGQQGSGELDLASAEQRELANSLLAQLVENAAFRSANPTDRREAEQALHQVRGDLADPQGIGTMIRPLVNALVRIGPFARLGFAVAEKLLVTTLREVTLYLTDDDIRQRAQQRVADLIGPETRVVIAHSLGTVVAFETLHRVAGGVPLLITLGSPLGLRTIVFDRLKPQPPSVPAEVRRWVNIADRDDLVAAEPDLTRRFPETLGVLESHYTVDNGANPHEATHYLTKPEVGAPVAQVLVD